MKNICFTGHRNIKITQELRERLYNLLETMIQNGAINFYAGGAIGFDTECELIILKLREKYPNIKLHIIMPCPKEEQTRKWKKDNEKKLYYKILSLADSTELCSEHYDKNCIKKRNARLVNLADCFVCYYYKSRSVTGQTISISQKNKLYIINLYE